MMPVGEAPLPLRDIHLPGPPPWWPPAPGWWLLTVIGALLLAAAAWGLVRYVRQRRRQRRFAAELQRLEQQLLRAAAPELLAHLSALLKRLALQRYPRGVVAALSGPEWLAFLDRSGGDGAFANGPGRVLADGGYRQRLPDELDVAALLRVVRRWVRRNTGVRR